MITNWYVTGDTHGVFTRFKNYSEALQKDKNAAVIILGDAGLNWTLDEHDSQLKNFLSKRYEFTIYCVHGNHEARPQNVDGMELVYDSDVKGMVYMQRKWPKIRYFEDWGKYEIDGYKTAVIGGAYSVDKWYRLDKGYIWYPDEQLSEDEQVECFQYICGAPREKIDRPRYDLVLTHTCPVQYEPYDLFLNGIDQSKVDKSMEIFLQKVYDNIYFKVWLWGHYHADRIERPHMEMFYKDTERLNEIIYRWSRYDVTHELDWWLDKSPNYYME